MKKFVAIVVGLPRYPVCDVDSYGVSTSHYAGSSGRADRTGGVTIGESHARGGQLVDVGGFVESAAICADVRPAHVVYEEEDKVHGLLLCHRTSGTTG